MSILVPPRTRDETYVRPRVLMAVVVPTPVITWIDLRPEDVSDAQAFIRAFREEGQRDELGFFGILGLFSGRFYPATTVQMSIARYFYLLPNVFEQVAARGLAGQSAFARGRELQREIRQHLATKGGPKIRNVDAKVLPSDVYWASLVELGFLLEPMTEREYAGWLAQETSAPEDDDHNKLEPERKPIWDRRRPRNELYDDRGHLKKGVRPILTESEANDLRARFEALPRDVEAPRGEPRNVLAHLVRLGRTNFQHVWTVAGLPAELKKLAEHARLVSLFARAVRLQYEVMLLEKKSPRSRGAANNAIEARRQALAGWWSRRRSELLRWNVEQFLALPGVSMLEATRTGVTGVERSFMSRWIARLGAVGSPKALLADATARQEVADREDRCKGSYRARLVNDDQLRAWKAGKVGGSADDDFGLEFRHGIGKSIAQEIIERGGTSA